MEAISPLQPPSSCLSLRGKLKKSLLPQHAASAERFDDYVPQSNEGLDSRENTPSTSIFPDRIVSDHAKNPNSTAPREIILIEPAICANTSPVPRTTANDVESRDEKRSLASHEIPRPNVSTIASPLVLASDNRASVEQASAEINPPKENDRTPRSSSCASVLSKSPRQILKKIRTWTTLMGTLGYLSKRSSTRDTNLVSREQDHGRSVMLKAIRDLPKSQLDQTRLSRSHGETDPSRTSPRHAWWQPSPSDQGAPFDFHHLPSSWKDLLENHGDLLEKAEGELLDWLETTEAMLERLCKRLWRLYARLLVYATVFCFLYSEFPHAMRHLCTTMPWTIWPALVVLWGVCWMFYPTPNDQAWNAEESDTFIDGLGADSENDFSYMDLLFPGPSLFEGNIATTPHTGSDVLSQRVAYDLQSNEPPDANIGISPSYQAIRASSNESDWPATSLSSSASPCALRVRTQAGVPSPWNVCRVGSAGAETTTDRDTSPFLDLPAFVHTLEQHIRATRFPCPYNQCKRAKPGKEFKRKEQLKRHLDVCKVRKRVTAEKQKAVFLSPFRGSEDDGSTSESQGLAGSSTDDRLGTVEIDDVRSLQPSHTSSTLLGLKARYKAQQAKVDFETQKLSHLGAVIQNWEED
ncbi:hypothetical protein G7046_g453 [Stylonectria norvegica]|nr:hypothetical protein G7046_g453 [Stylonectria norvegica]